MKIQDLQKPNYKKPKDSNLFDIIIYFIFTATMIMLLPLIFIIVMRFLNINIKETADIIKGVQGEVNIIKAKKYSYAEHNLDLSAIKNMGYRLLAANVTNNADGILFCGEMRENVVTREVLRIVKFKTDGEAEAYKNYLSNRFVEKIKKKEYVYKDYGDDYIYLANDETAYLFDIYEMMTEKIYYLPREYGIYQAMLSNGKEMMALATDKGLFVTDTEFKYPKELITAIENVSGVKTVPKYPVWSSDDEYIYYTLYADNYIKNAGRTPLALGANEQFTSLENTNFYVLSNGSIFYYYSTSYQTSFENMFRCGYFNVTDRKMIDMIKSHIYYFDIKVSSEGTHLAALSYTGKMKKISVIDIKTKKNIYSAIYDDIYEFAFSPNEKNIIIYGQKRGEENLRIIEIDWIEE